MEKIYWMGRGLFALGIILLIQTQHLNAWEIKGNKIIRPSGSIFWLEGPVIEGERKAAPIKGVLTIEPFKFKEGDVLDVTYTFEVLEDCEIPARLTSFKWSGGKVEVLEKPKFNIITKVDSYPADSFVWDVEKLKRDNITAEEMQKKEFFRTGKWFRYVKRILVWRKRKEKYVVFKKGDKGTYRAKITVKRNPKKPNVLWVGLAFARVRFQWHDSLGYFYPAGYFAKKYPEWCYKYDPVAWEFFEKTGVLMPDRVAKENYEFYKKVKEIEPSITDYEAMMLRRDFTLVFVAGVKIGVKSLDEEIEGAKWLLKQGWLKEMRKGEKEKDEWLKKILKKGKYGDKIIKDYIDKS